MCQITIFLTRVFIGRYTLHAELTYASQINPNFRQILGDKVNIFTCRQSKTKTKCCFLPVCFDLGLTSFLEICVRKKKLAQRIEQYARYKMRVLTKGRIDLASS